MSAVELSKTETGASTLWSAVDWSLNHPTVHRTLQQLSDHDTGTFHHTLRVTIGMITAADMLGLDPSFSGICSFMHDTGKLAVSQADLRAEPPDSHVLARIRLPHMEAVRSKILSIPEEEIDTTHKRRILAIVMAHHELLTPRNGATPSYPRSRESFRRKPFMLQEPEQAYALLLALCDIADRVDHGFFGTYRTDEDITQHRLRNIINDAEIHLDHDAQLYFSAIVSHAIHSITPQTVAEVEARIMR